MKFSCEASYLLQTIVYMKDAFAALLTSKNEGLTLMLQFNFKCHIWLRPWKWDVSHLFLDPDPLLNCTGCTQAVGSLHTIQIF